MAAIALATASLAAASLTPSARCWAQQPPAAAAAASPQLPSSQTNGLVEPTVRGPRGAPSPPASVEEVTPDVVYLMDRQGQLVRVPRESYEAWERGRRLQAGLEPSEPPAFAIVALDVDGRVGDDQAQLEVTIQIEVSRLRSTPLRIPLALGLGVLRDRPRYEGPGEILLQYSGQDGLVCWLTPRRPAETKTGVHGSTSAINSAGPPTSPFSPSPGDRPRTSDPQSPNERPSPNDRPPRPREPEPPAAAVVIDGSAQPATSRVLHTLQLPMLAPIQRDGGWSSLQMQFPNSAWRMQLSVADRPVTTEINDPGFLVTTESLGDGSRIFATGAKPDVRLRWRTDTGQSSETFLKSHATITIAADHPRLVYATAVLQVTAIGGPVPPFRVQFPANMQPILEPTPGVRIEQVRGANDNVAVEVRPESTASNQLRLTLKAVMKREERNASEPFEAAMFEVAGALLQTGEVRITAGDTWNLREVHISNMTRRAVTTEARESGRIAAVYEFSNRPCSLQLVAEARQSRLEVTPQYLLRVDPAGITLDARLRCRSGMTNVAALAVDLAGWSLVSVSPDSVVALEEVNLEQVEPLILPLRALDPMTDAVEVRLRATRSWRDGELIDVRLPTIRQPLTPQAALVVASAARVSVTADDPIELTIPEDSLRGLTEDAFPQTGTETTRQESWEFTETGGLAAQFAIQAKVRERRVTASHQAARLDLTDQQLEVMQRWSFRVDFGRLSVVRLDAAASMLSMLGSGPESEFRATLSDGRPLSWRLTGVADEQTPQVEIELGEDRREFELQVTYSLPRHAFEMTTDDDQESSSVVHVPLLWPALGVSMLDDPLIQVEVDDDVRAEPAYSAWSAMDAGGPLTLTSDGSVDELALKLTALEPSRPNALSMENCWLQTVLNHRERWDRVAYRLVSNRPQVSVRLPLGVVAERSDIRVLIDGQAASDFELNRIQGESGRTLVSVDWSSSGSDAAHTLELWYRFTARPAVGQLELEPPSVVGAADSRRSYWQLVLPANEHLIRESDMTPEWDVRWRGGWWFARTPRLDQRQLENWSGSSQAEPLPAGVNCYLFTDFGPIPFLRPWTVQRWALVAAASGFALLGGLALVYLPWLRRAPTLLVVAVALAAATAMFPESSVLAAQAACAGLLLVAVSLLLRRVLLRRPLTVEYHGPGPSPWDTAAGDSAGRSGSGAASDRITLSHPAIPLSSKP